MALRKSPSTEKKPEAPKVEEVKAVEASAPKEPEVQGSPKGRVVKLVANSANFRNPHTQVWFKRGIPVLCEIDRYLEAQIERGNIKVCDEAEEK
ncbi:MAG: hypothetical protein KAJ03_06795 [Gammaproteobacteria bacterium]|nr:hypothetical protein [Gammaproteobacteria bacterium]